MNTLVKRMLLGSSVLAVTAAAISARAQEPGAEIVEVSGSRINLSGFQSPTPVTVIGIESIERNAHINLGDEIRDIPQVRGDSTETRSTTNILQSNAGIDTLNLRGLGANRNLVLFDGQRSAISSIREGEVDLSTIPSALVQRVDVVTGGASAAWGSDAVTGVINVVINKNFTGAKLNVGFSDNLRISTPRYDLEAAWGTSFLGGKGHFVAGVTWTISNTPTFRGQNAPWERLRANVYNPAYCAIGGVTYAPGATVGGTCTSPTGARALMYAYGTSSVTNITQGGIINSHTAGTSGSGLASTSGTPNVNAGLSGLQGLMFAGQAAEPTAFRYGTQYGTTCYNGCTNNELTRGNEGFRISNLPYHSSTLFTYTSYQLTPDIKLGIQAGQSRYSTLVKGSTNSSNSKTIYADNAYLDSAIAQRFVCNPALGQAGTGAPCAAGTTVLSNGYNPFTGQNEIGAVGSSYDTLPERQATPAQRLIMGFDFSNNRVGPYQGTAPVNGSGHFGLSANPNIWTMANVCSAIGEACGNYARVYNRFSAQLDGTLADSWNWSAYIAWSGLRQRQTTPNNAMLTRLNNALDAVRITSGNQGTSGLPIGSIQCRGLLNAAALAGATAQDDLAGCVPINHFGFGNVSQAAYQWISPGVNPGPNPYLNQVTTKTGQTAIGGELNGVLPWQLPAGEILVATGFDYRLEHGGQYDAPAFSGRGIMVAGNWRNFTGHYNVKEGFLEVNLPILKNMLVDTFDINLAGRFTSYSISGDVQTWKIGFNSQINDDFRVRGFYSADIRAPHIWDFFAPGSPAQQPNGCASWVDGGPANTCLDRSGGNTNLVPEKAHTVALGVVFTPTFIEGLTASLDWYDLRMHGAIGSIGRGTLISLAKQGHTQYCSVLITSDGSNICSYSQAAGTVVPQIIEVLTGPINADRQTTAGFDANIDYRFDLWSGNVGVGVNASYMYDWSIFRLSQGIYYQGAGTTGGFHSGGPNFRSTINLTYSLDAWTFGANIHVVGDAVRNDGTQGRAGLTATTVTFRRFPNGLDEGTLVNGGNAGEGFLPSNYRSWLADIGFRIQYRLSDSIQLYANMDRVFPGSTAFDGGAGAGTSGKTYRVGARFRF
ncbi:MAG TPA: TonB-dependent receptor [Rhizomicrobium sp.]|nr:TonB-dependent receptor [Rhizomicrobium sp.]